MLKVQKSSLAGCGVSSELSQGLLAFPLADKWFALPLESVRAVMTANLLQPLVGSSDGLAGWLEIQGQEVLVLDMTQVLVPGAGRASPEQIILLRAGTSWTGLITAGTSETINIPAAQIEQPCDSADVPRWAMGTCRVAGRSITVLDPDRFVENPCPAS